jgi:hypothetical protein
MPGLLYACQVLQALTYYPGRDTVRIPHIGSDQEAITEEIDTAWNAGAVAIDHRQRPAAKRHGIGCTSDAQTM